jgi:hypothetical protein
MLAAIQLDDDACLETNEIADVTANLALASELEAVELTPPQPLPEPTFSFSGVVAARRNYGSTATVGYFLI